MCMSCFSWSDILFGISIVLMAAGVIGTILLELKGGVEEWGVVLVFAMFVLSWVLMMFSLRCSANEYLMEMRQILRTNCQ